MDESIEKVKARLITNTRTRNRIDNLYDTANLILKLKNNYGSLKMVSENVADISPNMLNRFLSVLKLDKSIIPFVKSRELDNINAAYYIQTLMPDDQRYIAELLTSKRINSADIRSIRPLKKKSPHKTIQEILKTVIDSKNKKRYLIKFDISPATKLEKIEMNLKKILLKDDYLLEKKKNVGTIILTKYGNDILKSYAVKKNKKYREIVSKILNN